MEVFDFITPTPFLCMWEISDLDSDSTRSRNCSTRQLYLRHANWVIRLIAVSVLWIAGHSSVGAAITANDLIALRFTNAPNQILQARLHVPKTLDPQKRYPFVCFLHGAGERGSDNRAQVEGTSAVLTFLDPTHQTNWPCFFLAPQCPAGLTWAGMNAGDNFADTDGTGDFTVQPTWPLTAFMKMLGELTNSVSYGSSIDTQQLYLTGLSMGGYGTWDVLCRWPGVFQKAVPICGGGDPKRAGSITASDIWDFHAEDDGTVPFARSLQMVQALRSLHRTIRFTQYPANLGIGHASWVPAYGDAGLLPWLFGGAESIPATDQLSPPSFNPPPGTYVGNTLIQIQSETPDAVLRYTLDGTAPTTRSPIYTNAILANGPLFLRAIAVKPGLKTSDVRSGDYTITPSILTAPTQVSVLVGKPVKLSVLAVGIGELRYQWFRNQTAIPDATNSVLALGPGDLAFNGVYVVEIRDDRGLTTSKPVSVIVSILPKLITTPEPLTVVEGDDARFEVSASGTVPMTFRWKRNGSSFTNQTLMTTQAVLTIPDVKLSQAGNFTVAVTNFGGSSATSPTATMTVLADIDHDHLPDVWEVAHGLDPNSPTETLLDPDGDGANNREEWLAGTDPQDANSVLKISVNSLPSNTIRLRFTTVIGKHYRIESTQTLLDNASWIALSAGDSIRGTGEVLERELNINSADSPLYYRCVVAY